MVTKVRTEVLDDLTMEDGATTRTFSIEGQHYEIDLVESNWTEFQDAVKKFVDASRLRGAKRNAQQERSRGAAQPDNAKIREWAREHGHEVPERGRIPEAIRKAYEDANKKR